MIKRIINNTTKQILRAGWSAWASISVMTLAYMVGSIFLGIAYFAHLNIRKIESRNNMIVFFEIGMDKEIINRLWEKWKSYPDIREITFTSEEEAYNMFSDYTAKVSPIHYETLKSFREPKLNSSLDIKLHSIENFETLKKMLQKDIDEENKKLIIYNFNEQVDTTQSIDQTMDVTILPTPTNTDKDNLQNSISAIPTSSQVVRYKYSTMDGRPPIILKSDDTKLEQQRELFNSLRIVGISIIVLLFIVIFFFTFMTVEFRLYNQMEEISVMQLVGGSLFFIRAPYILEGGFYGFVGALISSVFLSFILLSIFVWNSDSVISKFFWENFADLEWPYITQEGLILVILCIAMSGFILGAASSFLSIRRYIK
ncbi:MAG: permease-like cell division protein FtsX [Candidatus Dojkabacteria bacterium]|nr:permease-like cell division protein FtsX [Candidatus Dojkabacteria bacterium]